MQQIGAGPRCLRITHVGGVFLTLLSTLAGGCREPVAESWTTELEYSIGADTTGADTTLLKPSALGVTDDGTIVIADAGAAQLRFIDPATHTIRRTLGAKGQGPGEFTRPVELSMAPDGRIAVGDASTRRVTVFAPDGQIVNEIGPDQGRSWEIAFDTRGRLHLNRRTEAKATGEPTVSIMAADGSPAHTYGNFLLTENPLDRMQQNVVRLAPAPDGGMWVLHNYRAFIERYDATGQLVRRFPLPLQEGQDTVGPIVAYVDNNPDLISMKRIVVADDLATMGDTLLLVAMLPRNDSTGFRTRLVAFDTLGAQRFKLDLPRRAERLATHDGRVVTLTFDGGDPARIDVFKLVRAR